MSFPTLHHLHTQFLSGASTPTSVLADIRAVIRDKNPAINAYLTEFSGAEAQAHAATARYQKEGDRTPLLCGIPVAVKNNILVHNERATAASRILEEYRAPYDATIIARLKEAGAVLVGGTNLDEFAMGSSTEHSAFGSTKNPFDTTRVPGGSSGGSAAAVAMKAATVALGTDTGGSVRQPASFCGLVGLKPTYGAVSRYGLIAMGSSLDQPGVLAHTVADVEAVFSVIAGHDPLDATTIQSSTYPPVPLKPHYRIGVPRDVISPEGLDPDVAALFEKHLEELTRLGHEVVEVSLPRMKAGLAAYYIVMPAEVSSNLARYDGVRFGLHVSGNSLFDDYEKTRAQGLGAEVKRRVLVGTYVLSAGYYDAYYKKAEEVRRLMRDEMTDAFRDVDVLATPTTPTPAFSLGEKSDPVSMYLQDIFTVPANLTGIPALSVPMGTARRRGCDLPVGVQYMCPHGGEPRLFDIAARMKGEQP